MDIYKIEKSNPSITNILVYIYIYIYVCIHMHACIYA